MIYCGDTIWQQFNFPIMLSSSSSVAGIGGDGGGGGIHCNSSTTLTIIIMLILILIQKIMFNFVGRFIDVASICWRRIYSGQKMNGGNFNNHNNNVINKIRDNCSDKMLIERIVRNKFSIEGDGDGSEMGKFKCIKCQSNLNILVVGRLTKKQITMTRTTTTSTTTTTNCKCSDRICNVVVQFCDDDYHFDKQQQQQHLIILKAKTLRNDIATSLLTTSKNNNIDIILL